MVHVLFQHNLNYAPPHLCLLLLPLSPPPPNFIPTLILTCFTHLPAPYVSQHLLSPPPTYHSPLFYIILTCYTHLPVPSCVRLHLSFSSSLVSSLDASVWNGNHKHHNTLPLTWTWPWPLLAVVYKKPDLTYKFYVFAICKGKVTIYVA